MKSIPYIYAAKITLALLVSIELVGCSFTPLRSTEDSDGASLASESLTTTGDNEEADEKIRSDSEKSTRESARDAERALNMFLRDQKVIFPKGEIEFETTFQRTNDSQKNVRLGAVVIPVTSRESSSIAFQIRYAITDNLETSIRLPWLYTKSDFDFAFLPAVEGLSNDEEYGLADVQVALRYQLLRETHKRPDVALSFQYKADTAGPQTGTDDQSLGFATTVVRTIDPAVVFLQAEYVFVVSDGDLERGDQYSLLLGTGFSLNDRVGYNVRYTMRFTERTNLSGESVRGTDQTADSLQFGLTVQLGKNSYIEPELSIGLTDDAPDSQFRISLTF